MKNNVVKNKSFDFALRIVKMHEFLCEHKKESVLSKQLLQSGTAIGVLVSEAEQEKSKADFIHKMAIALQKANVTEYWIELLFQSNYIDETEYNSTKTDLTEILKLLTSIIKTTKHNTKK